MRLNEQTEEFDEQRKFTGHEYDEATGLNYMVARYQSGELGRFLSVDPLYLSVGDTNFQAIAGYEQSVYLSDPQRFNSYAYVGNNPLKYFDPLGLDKHIFFDPHNEGSGFVNQAKAEYNRMTTNYNEPVIAHPIYNVEDFTSAWDSMGQDGSDIDEVTLIFHGSSQTINIDAETNQYLTTLELGITPKGNPAKYIGSLEKKDIGKINIFSCQSGNIWESNNVAKTFAITQNTNVTAMDGYTSFNPITYNPTPGNLSGFRYFFNYGHWPIGWVKYSSDGKLLSNKN